MRNSRDEYDEEGMLKNGFDYDLQVWVKDYSVQDCGHNKVMWDCDCNGRKYKDWAIDLAREAAGLPKTTK